MTLANRQARRAAQRAKTYDPLEPAAGYTVVPGDTELSRVGGTMGTDLPASREGELLMLRWVDEATVPDDHKAFVQGHVERVSQMLDLVDVPVRWFDLARDGRGDFVYPARKAGVLPAAVTPNPEHGHPVCIGLNATLRGDRIVAGAIAHELRHHHQIRLRQLLMDPESCERDSDRWAGTYLDQLEDQ